VLASGLFFAFRDGPSGGRRQAVRLARGGGCGRQAYYTRGGHGTPLILLHGYAETSRMWTPILPVLGEQSTVIALDLPGIGESSIPAR